MQSSNRWPLRVFVCVCVLGVPVCRADAVPVPPRGSAVPRGRGLRERLAWCRHPPLLQPEGTALRSHCHAQGGHTHTHTHY